MKIGNIVKAFDSDAWAESGGTGGHFSRAHFWRDAKIVAIHDNAVATIMWLDTGEMAADYLLESLKNEDQKSI